MYIWDADRIRFYKDASERTGFYSCVTKLLYPALSREKTICDAGCGLGYLSLHLAPYVKSVSAIDCNGDAIRVLKKNAEMLKTGSIEIAKESERGIVDIETLAGTNKMLIDTLEEVQQIQRDGSAKRREAEAELGRIEGELKQKLLDLRK